MLLRSHGCGEVHRSRGDLEFGDATASTAVERPAQARSSPSRVLSTHSEARALWGGCMPTRRPRCEVSVLAMSKVQWSFHPAKSIPPRPREAPAAQSPTITTAGTHASGRASQLSEHGYQGTGA